MTILLSLLACQPASITTEGATAAPVVAQCIPGVVASVASQGPVWSVVVTLPNGARIAPMTQIFSDKVDVYCPPEGGTLTIEWGE